MAPKIFGFSEHSNDSYLSEKQFIEAVQMGLNNKDGKYSREFNRIYNNLKGNSAQLTAENIGTLGEFISMGAFHESLHFGQIHAMKRIVLKSLVK